MAVDGSRSSFPAYCKHDIPDGTWAIQFSHLSDLI